MFYGKDNPSEKDFAPKRFCTCRGSDGKPYQILDDDEWKGGIGLHCVLCGHFRWQEYVKSQIGHLRRSKPHN